MFLNIFLIKDGDDTRGLRKILPTSGAVHGRPQRVPVPERAPRGRRLARNGRPFVVALPGQKRGPHVRHVDRFVARVR